MNIQKLKFRNFVKYRFGILKRELFDDQKFVVLDETDSKVRRLGREYDFCLQYLKPQFRTDAYGELQREFTPQYVVMAESKYTKC